MPAYELRISNWSSDLCSSDLLDRVDRGDAGQCSAARYRRKKLDTPARPHAAGQLDGREQALPVAARMAVRADQRLVRGREEIEPVAERRGGCGPPRGDNMVR